MTAGFDAQIGAVAGRQGRNATRKQLLDLGLSDNGIAYRVRVGRLHREHNGVYSVGTPATTPHERAWAAVLACGPRALLAEFSAMALWTFVKRWPATLTVVTPGQRRPKGIVVRRSTTLTARDCTRQFGIPVTSPARTMLDCAPRLNNLDRVIHDALHTPWLKLGHLEEACTLHPTHPGVKLILPHVISVDGPSRSDWELGFPDWCVGHGLPRPVRNIKPNRREADFWFAEERLIVELDSWTSHGTKYAHEDDRERDTAHLDADIETVRLTWARYTRTPEKEAARLGRILARRREYLSRG